MLSLCPLASIAANQTSNKPCALLRMSSRPARPRIAQPSTGSDWFLSMAINLMAMLAACSQEIDRSYSRLPCESVISRRCCSPRRMNAPAALSHMET
jgi:hypothetical protein